ncbi:macro domain-containing protein [Paraclostridium sordellii]|uniref:macro domain-containing protein n=1 Tax=Paraclostridium sordellii TaxID=1505 RepID=UPI0005DDDFE7|nr:macro domain-containing protein [Paeniclostridium sordellii]CEN93735.1 Appr-1-p processing protein [[Clostridium] sordellii] [Paeniclostridium sordellii]CEN95103.1 Appr-1-p processing protein [[Clostridium] sordellii] [Paeniclostridium sordellii]CEQ26143.1 Appr-1-p processing protein [[Clostridium] sordellii] [Paeniclostridium sordellii]
MNDKKNKDILDKISVVQGNIVDIRCRNGKKLDAIVNAAKPTLMGGSGVDGAIHEKINNILKNKTNSGISFKDKIKEEIDGNVESKENRVRCKHGEVVVTKGYGLCEYIFHAVGPKWDGGSKSCIDELKSCYKTIIEKMIEYNCETIAIPVISSGSYGFPFHMAAKIEIISIFNELINLKKIERYEYERIKKIYLVVYEKKYKNDFLIIYNQYSEKISLDKRLTYLNIKESINSYSKDINLYDSDKRNYFGLVRILRKFLIKSDKIFFITYLLKRFTENGTWQRRRNVIEIQVFIKMMFPLIFLHMDRMKNFNPILIFICIYLMAETIIYALKLIFLADIQNPSANIYRSVILLLLNYAEIIFEFSFLYKALDVFKATGMKTIDFVYFSITNSYDGYISTTGKFLVCTQKCVSLIFLTVVMSYFLSNFQQRKFNS